MTGASPPMRALLACCLVLWGTPAFPQQAFDNVLSIQQGGKETGREEYSIQRGIGSGPTVIKAQARYPTTSPTLQIGLTEERSPTAGIAKFELDVQAPELLPVPAAGRCGDAQRGSVDRDLPAERPPGNAGCAARTRRGGSGPDSAQRGCNGDPDGGCPGPAPAA